MIEIKIEEFTSVVAALVILSHVTFLVIRHMWLWFNRRRPATGYLTDEQLDIVCTEKAMIWSKDRSDGGDTDIDMFANSGTEGKEILYRRHAREYTNALYNAQKKKLIK